MNLISKIRNLIKRGIVSLPGDDSGVYPRSQVIFMGKVKQVEMVSPYGLFSNAPKDSCALLFSIQGQEENIAGVGYSPLSRFKNLKSGEVVVGNPGTGSYVKFSSDGTVTVYSAADVNIQGAGAINITSSTATKITCTNCTIAASGNIALGSGGKAVARVGDAVQVSTSTGIGTITAGSSKVTSV